MVKKIGIIRHKGYSNEIGSNILNLFKIIIKEKKIKVKVEYIDINKNDYDYIIVPPFTLFSDSYIVLKSDLENCNIRKYLENSLKSFEKFLCILGDGISYLNNSDYLKEKSLSIPDIYIKDFSKKTNIIDKNIFTLSSSNLVTFSYGSYYLHMINFIIQKIEGNLTEIPSYFLVNLKENNKKIYHKLNLYLNHNDTEILKAQNYIISTNNTKKIFLKDLCRVSGLEIRALQRRFLKATGITARDYIKSFYIDLIINQIIYTNISFKQIAKEFFYKDFYSFTQFFKKNVGINPSEYRSRFSFYNK